MEESDKSLDVGDGVVECIEIDEFRRRRFVGGGGRRGREEGSGELHGGKVGEIAVGGAGEPDGLVGNIHVEVGGSSA